MTLVRLIGTLTFVLAAVGMSGCAASDDDTSTSGGALETSASTSAGVAGTLTNGGAAVANALVKFYLLPQPQGGVRVTQSNADGEYVIETLPVGKYVVIIEKAGDRIYQGEADLTDGANTFDVKF